MDTFDGSKPDLISSKLLKDIESKLDIKNIDNGNKVLNGLGSFYENYILPNMFPLIVIMLLILYLTIKYILKKDREENGEDDSDEKEEEENNKEIADKIIMIKRKIDNKVKKIEKEDKVSISDMISDDYLITDDDSDDDNNNKNKENKESAIVDNEQQIEIMENRDTVIDKDKAALLVFGK